MLRFRKLAAATLSLSLICYVGLFLVSTLLSDAWTIPLTAGVFVFGAVSFLAALKARSDVLTIVAALVAFVLLPMTYILTVFLGGP